MNQKNILLKTSRLIKRFFLLLITCVVAAPLAAQARRTITIEGTVTQGISGKVYLQKFNDKLFEDVDSVNISEGKFHFRTSLEVPELYGLTLDRQQTPYYLFIDSEQLQVHLDPAERYARSSAKGSWLQDEYMAYRQLKGVNISEYIKRHPASLVAAYVLYREYSYRLTPDEIRANIGLLDPSLLETPYVKVLQEFANTMEAVSIGTQAPDFEMPDVDGKPFRLSDAFGKGYLLIDFWASWCGPCRKENPNVVAAYRQFHNKGFDIIGVSLDRNKEKWLQAIADDGLIWQHVSDLKFWNNEAAKLYGIRVIPSNVLVDSKGKIIARNLRGEDLLHTLAELIHP